MSYSPKVAIVVAGLLPLGPELFAIVDIINWVPITCALKLIFCAPKIN